MNSAKAQNRINKHVLRLLLILAFLCCSFVTAYADDEAEPAVTEEPVVVVEAEGEVPAEPADVVVEEPTDVVTEPEAEVPGEVTEPAVPEEEPAVTLTAVPEEPAEPAVAEEPPVTVKQEVKKPVKNGWVKGKYYVKGKVKKGLFTVKGKTYYAKKDGTIVKNKMVQTRKGRYYFGKTGAALKGYIKVNKGVRYIAGKNGKIKTGLVSYNGNKYYARKNGTLVRHQLKKVGSNTYYFNTKGAAIKNKTKVINGWKYTFNKKGVKTAKTPTGELVAQTALRYTGRCPYVWGGSNLAYGVDCSGFTMCIYQQFGIYLPHYSQAQASCGRAVSIANLRPGDICVYSGHVAMYIGNGQIVHAASPRTGICVSTLNYGSGYPFSCRRLV